MDDSISRKAAIAAIQNLYPGMPRMDVCNSLNRWYEKNKQYIECEDAINKLPSKQSEQKKGKWINEPNCWYRCSQCRSHYPSFKDAMDYNYCPNCGCAMEGAAMEGAKEQ